MRLNKPWINNSARVYTECIYLWYWPGCLQGLPLYRQSALYQTWESIVLGSSSEWSGSLSERDPVLESTDRDVRSQVHWSAASFDMCSVQSARILSPPTSVLLQSAQCVTEVTDAVGLYREGTRRCTRLVFQQHSLTLFLLFRFFVHISTSRDISRKPQTSSCCSEDQVPRQYLYVEQGEF
jgi:hypothetical protein